MLIESKDQMKMGSSYYEINCCPLKIYFEKNTEHKFEEYIFKYFHYYYSSYWIIEDNQLKLTYFTSKFSEHTMESLFKTSNNVLADWYSGDIFMGTGEYNNIPEEPFYDGLVIEGRKEYYFYLHLEIKEGKVLNRKFTKFYFKPVVLNFGKHNGSSLTELIYGSVNKIDNEYIKLYLNELILTLMYDKDILNFLGGIYNVNLIKHIETKNPIFDYMVSDNFISFRLNYFSFYSGSLIISFINILTNILNNSSNSISYTEDNKTLFINGYNLSSKINPQMDYIKWAIKNVRNFSVPPHYLDSKYELTYFNKFDIDIINPYILGYKINTTIKVIEFDNIIKSLNLSKFQTNNNLIYDKEINGFNCSKLPEFYNSDYLINEWGTENDSKINDYLEHHYIVDPEKKENLDYYYYGFLEGDGSNYWNID